MAKSFLVVGLPASFTTEQLRQLLGTEASNLQNAEMLPDTIATGVGYVQMTNPDAGQRVARRFQSTSMQHMLGTRPLICRETSRAFHAISKRWEAERAHAY